MASYKSPAFAIVPVHFHHLSWGERIWWDTGIRKTTSGFLCSFLFFVTETWRKIIISFFALKMKKEGDNYNIERDQRNPKREKKLKNIICTAGVWGLGEGTPKKSSLMFWGRDFSLLPGRKSYQSFLPLCPDPLCTFLKVSDECVWQRGWGWGFPRKHWLSWAATLSGAAGGSLQLELEDQVKAAGVEFVF